MKLRFGIAGFFAKLGVTLVFFGSNCLAGALGSFLVLRVVWVLTGEKRSFSMPTLPGLIALTAFIACFFGAACLLGDRYGNVLHRIDRWLGSHEPRPAEPPAQPVLEPLSRFVRVAGSFMEYGATAAFVVSGFLGGATGVFLLLRTTNESLLVKMPGWLVLIAFLMFAICFFSTIFFAGPLHKKVVRRINQWVKSHEQRPVEPPAQPTPPKPQGPLSEERMGKIALLYVREQLRKEGGSLLTPNFRREVGNTAKAIGITTAEAMMFIEALVREMVDQTFGPPKN